MVLDIVTLENGKQAPIIDAEKTLLKYGVCRVRVPFTPEENHHWSQVSASDENISQSEVEAYGI